MSKKAIIRVTLSRRGNEKSLKAFGIPYYEIPGHGLVCKKEFDNVHDAQNYLMQRAELYAKDNLQQLNRYLEQIGDYNRLQLGEATAVIEEVAA